MHWDYAVALSRFPLKCARESEQAEVFAEVLDAKFWSGNTEVETLLCAGPRMLHAVSASACEVLSVTRIHRPTHSHKAAHDGIGMGMHRQNVLQTSVGAQAPVMSHPLHTCSHYLALSFTIFMSPQRQPENTPSDFFLILFTL